MEWQDLGTFTVSNNWQYTEQVNGRDFKIVYLSSSLLARDSTAIIALSSIEAINGESTEFFKAQRVNSYLSSEIVQFPNPPKNWHYRLAIKKLVMPNQPPTPDFTIQIFMPVIDLTPDQPVINPTISTTKNVVNVPIAGTATTSVKLLPASASNNRKHATFYNPSTKRNLYVDTDSTISTASAVAKIAPGKIYVSDFPNWQGEYWGMMDGTDTVATAIAIEEYV